MAKRGRKPFDDEVKIRRAAKLIRSGIKPYKAAKIVQVSPSTIYKLIKTHDKLRLAYVAAKERNLKDRMEVLRSGGTIKEIASRLGITLEGARQALIRSGIRRSSWPYSQCGALDSIPDIREWFSTLTDFEVSKVFKIGQSLANYYRYSRGIKAPGGRLSTRCAKRLDEKLRSWVREP